MNCPIYKSTYYLILELLTIVCKMPTNMFIFNFLMEVSDPVVIEREIKSEVIERMLEIHKLINFALYPSH